jgi:predicted flap endonuclease-1-like 5' DNA nuclease
MLWLIIHEWLLLLVAFLLGLLIGWWIWARRQADIEPAYTAPPHPRDSKTEIAPLVAVPAERVTEEAPASSSDKPVLYDKPSDGPADDLKKISGIGPKYEKLLNDIGIYYYKQIADWTPEQISWLDNRLEFPGRIVRDKWQEQASVLLSGGSTNFATRYKKGETGIAAGGSTNKSLRHLKYLDDVRRYDSDADEEVVRRIVNHLGIALNNLDASLVSCSDKAERDRVRDGFCAKKLQMDQNTAEKAVEGVCQTMKADRNKQRVTFYYLLAKNAGKLADV